LENAYPVKIGSRRNILTEILQAKNYRTIGVQDSNPFLTSVFGYDRGFDVFQDFIFKSDKRKEHSTLSCIKDIINKIIKNNNELKRLNWAFQSLFNLRMIKGAEQVASKALNEVEKNTRKGDPVFLWAHFIDAHFIYSPPGKYRERLKWFSAAVRNFKTDWADLPEEKLRILKELYILEIKYVYNVLSGFIESLEKIGINGENSYFIVTADHGEEFAEHGNLSHQNTLYNELLHVPLAILGPGIKKGIVKAPISLIDIAPTILDLVNIEIPTQFKGRSFKNNLLNGDYDFDDQKSIMSLSLTEKGKFQIATQTVRSKCIANITNNSIASSQFFDLKEDPEELNSISRCSEESALLEPINNFIKIRESNKEKDQIR
jgi:arylsulfatase A-like enzyme